MRTLVHLLKYEFSYKRSGYATALGSAFGIIIFNVLNQYYSYPKFLTLLIPGILILLTFLTLFYPTIFPMAAKGQGKSTLTGYSWSYVLSVIRTPKIYLSYLVVYYLLNAIIISFLVFLWDPFPKQTTFIVLGIFFIIFVVFITFQSMTLDSSVGGYKGRSLISSFKNFTVIRAMVLLGILLFFLQDNLIIRIPAGVLIFAIAPPLILSGLYLPIRIYLRLVSDFNYKERIRRLTVGNLLALLAIGCGILYFYEHEYKSGHYIFDEITEGRIESVKRKIHKYPYLLKVRDKYGRTPLLAAARYDYTELVLFFLSQKANINEVDTIGNNLLTYTASNCNLGLTEELVNRGINTKNMPSDFENPYYSASRANCLPLIFYFQKLGMDDKTLNKKGESFIEYGKNNAKSFESTWSFMERNELFPKF